MNATVAVKLTESVTLAWTNALAVVVRLVATIGILILTACSASHNGSASSASEITRLASPQSIEAFQTTLYSYGNTQGCVKCHGGRVSPLWMSSDMQFAYSLAAARVDFANPAGSVFAEYASNNHCNDPVCQDSASSAVIQTHLTQWAEVEALASGGVMPITGGTTLANPAFVTATMAMPAGIPLITSSTPAVLRFQLSALNPVVPALQNAILEISIQYYNAAQSEYKIFNPRLLGASGPVSLSSLHIYIRPAAGTGLGMEDSSQGLLWSALNVSPAIFAIPNPLPTTPVTGATPLTKLSLALEAQSTADVITIGFAAIQ